MESSASRPVEYAAAQVLRIEKEKERERKRERDGDIDQDSDTNDYPQIPHDKVMEGQVRSAMTVTDAFCSMG